MDKCTQAIVEHYQKTYELTYALWQQRNRAFLYLLGVIAGATLLTFDAPTAKPLLVHVVAKFAGVTGDTALTDLRAGFPFGLLQTILLVVVLYLVVSLYHRATYVLRNYRYLSGLEGEIRESLNLPEESVAFTRESTFYWGERPRLSGLVKWVYIVILGLLLLAFLGGRVAQDLASGNWLLFAADLAIALPTLLFYYEYARSSVALDAAGAILGDKRSKAEGA